MPVHPIIPRVGGKSKIAKKIIEMIPPHKIYVEPFVGGGSVFFKKPEAEVNIINDLDKDIYNIYLDITKVKNIDDFHLYETNKEEFEKYKKQTKFKNSKERLYRNIYLSKNSYSGNRNAFNGNIKTGIVKFKKNYNDIRNKLINTIILNKDYKKVIEKYDSLETFFYLDPPYTKLNKSWGYKENTVTREELLNVLKNIKGKFLMSYDFNKENVELFSQFFKVIEINQIYKLSGKQQNIKEIIILNY
jgi:DNA adenine methylase